LKIGIMFFRTRSFGGADGLTTVPFFPCVPRAARVRSVVQMTLKIGIMVFRAGEANCTYWNVARSMNGSDRARVRGIALSDDVHASPRSHWRRSTG
jgi:hypothetical protein